MPLSNLGTNYLRGLSKSSLVGDTNEANQGLDSMTAAPKQMGGLSGLNNIGQEPKERNPYPILTGESFGNDGYVFNNEVDRTRFSEDLRKNIYGDKTAQDLIRERQEALPEIFNRMFKGKATWDTREKLNNLQRQYWRNYLSNYAQSSEQEVALDQKQKDAQYKRYFDLFEKEVSEYEKGKERVAAVAEKRQEAVGRAARVFADVKDPTEWKYRKQLLIQEYGDDVAANLDEMIPDEPDEKFKKYIIDASKSFEERRLEKKAEEEEDTYTVPVYKGNTMKKVKVPVGEFVRLGEGETLISQSKGKKMSKLDVKKAIAQTQEKIDKLKVTGAFEGSPAFGYMSPEGAKIMNDLMKKGDVTASINAYETYLKDLESIYPSEEEVMGETGEPMAAAKGVVKPGEKTANPEADIKKTISEQFSAKDGYSEPYQENGKWRVDKGNEKYAIETIDIKEEISKQFSAKDGYSEPYQKNGKWYIDKDGKRYPINISE